MSAEAKRSSLLRKSIDYVIKSFLRLSPGEEVTKRFLFFVPCGATRNKLECLCPQSFFQLNLTFGSEAGAYLIVQLTYYFGNPYSKISD